MLAARITRTGCRSIPLYRNLSIVASAQADFSRHTAIPNVPNRTLAGTRSLSLWWGRSKPTQESPLPNEPPSQPPSELVQDPEIKPEPDITNKPESTTTLASSNPPGTPDTPAVEITQIEPNVIPEELVSSTSSSFDALVSTPAVHQIGDFAAAGFASRWPPGLVQSALELIHVHTGLPWWASIVLLTALVRAAILPLNLTLVGNASRLAKVQPQLTALADQVKRARQVGDSAALQHAGYRAQLLMEQAKASPFKGLLGPLVQMPVALSFFFGIRNICNAKLATLQTGGIAWFTDLTVADPTWVLPIMSSAAMVILLETSAVESSAGAASHARNFFRVLAIITIPIVSYLPSGVLVYFITNGAFMLIQSALVKIPTIRRRYNILDKPAPPPGAKITKPPTFMDSLRALGQGFQEAAQKAREQRAQDTATRARGQKRR